MEGVKYLFHYVIHPSDEHSFDELLTLFGLENDRSRCKEFGIEAVTHRGWIHLYPAQSPELHRGAREALERSLLRGKLKDRLIASGAILEVTDAAPGRTT